MTGALFVSSCSSDDSQLEEVTQPKIESSTTYSQTLTDASKKLNLELSSINLGDLAPLDDALNNGCECECKCGDNCNCEGCKDNHKKFSEALKELLNKLNEDFSTVKPYAHTYTFEDIMKYLKLTWTFSGFNGIGREDGKGFVENANTKMFECVYKTDAGTYIVTTGNGVFHQTFDRVSDGHTAQRLLIKKDDVSLLDITVSKFVGEHRALPFMPAESIDYMGNIKLKGLSISLDMNSEEAHERNLSLKVEKEGTEGSVIEITSTLTDNRTLANILKGDVVFASDFKISFLGGNIAINGKVKDVNKFIAESLALIGVNQKGVTEELCKTIVTNFNENSSFNLVVNGTDMGKLYLQPVYNKESDNYIPALLIASSLLGEEPVNIGDVLSSFGFSFEDILKIIQGRPEA